MYDQRRDTPKYRRKTLVKPGRNTLRISRHYSAPHHDGLHPRGEGLLDRPPAQLGEDLVVRDAVGIRPAEDLLEPRPEVRQSHSASVPPAPASPPAPAGTDRRRNTSANSGAVAIAASSASVG